MDVLETLDNLQSAAQEDIKKKQEKSHHPEYNFDKLKMYFGEDYTIGGITISIPTIGDILDIGETNFYQAMSPFVNNPTSIRVLLYDAFHKDWTKTKDIESFFILYQMLKIQNDKTLLSDDNIFNIYHLVFKGVELDNLSLKSDENGALALIDEEQDLVIYEDDYLEIAEYIRTFLNIHPKVEKGKGKTTKLWMLQEDRMKEQENKNREPSSTLLPLVSGCINHPGFKYKLEELKQVNIYQFMDSVHRIQKYEQGTAAIKGMYSGFVSSKDIPQDVINFMGEI